MGLQTRDTFAYVELVKRVKIVKKVTNLFVLMTNNQSMQWKNLMLRQIIQRFIYLQKHVGQQHFLQR